MDEVFQFVTLMVLSHLLLGSLLVIVARIILRLLPLNAATRHNIWLTLFIFLTLMPLISFTSFGMLNQSSARTASTITNSPAQGLARASELSTPYLESNVEELRTPASIESSEIFSGNAISPTETVTTSAAVQFAEAVLRSLPLERIGIALSFIIAFGIFIKSFLFIRAYQNLKELFTKSIPLDNEWRTALADLTTKMQVSKQLKLVHSERVNTPLSSGIFNHWIVLPTTLLETRQSSLFMKQILLHELAHIKRRDPLTASLQALISVFLFWHPALRYAGKQIRFERELACDDWIIRFSKHETPADIQSYASNLLSIAESLQYKVPTTHSVACVHTSYGLANRINLLLDRDLDHSTSIQRLPNAALSCLVLLLLITSSPLWPQIPTIVAEEAHNDTVSLISAADKIPELTSEAAAELETASAFLEFARSESKPVVETQQLVKADTSVLVPQETLDAIDLEPTLETTQYSQTALKATNMDVPASEPQHRSLNYLSELNLDDKEPKPVLEIKFNRIAPAEIELAYDPIRLESVKPELVENPQISLPPTQNAPTESAIEPLSAVAILDNSNTEKSIEPIIQGLAAEDERIVIDDLTRSELRQEILKIETEFYRVFSVSVEDRKFKIHCGAIYQTGSYIRRQVCEPNFVIEAQSAYAQGVLESYDMSRSSIGLRVDMQPEFDELAEAIVLELKDNEYLFELYNVLKSLKYRLEEIA